MKAPLAKTPDHKKETLKEVIHQLTKSELFHELIRTEAKKIYQVIFLLVGSTAIGLYAIQCQSDFFASLKPKHEFLFSEDLSKKFMTLFLIYAISQLIYEGMQYLKRRVSNGLSTDITNTLKTKIFDRSSSLPFEAMEKEEIGNILQLFSSDTSQVAALIADGLLPFAMTLIMALGVSLLITLKIGPTGLLFLLTLLILIYFAQKFSRETAWWMRERAQVSAVRIGEIEEAVKSAMPVKMLGLERPIERRVEDALQRETHARLASNRMSSKYMPLFASLRWVAWWAVLVEVVYFGKGRNALEGSALVSLIFAVNWYSALLQEAYLFVGMYLGFIQVGAVSLSRLEAFFERTALAHTPLQWDGPATEPVCWELKDIHVEYPKRPGVWALKNCDLKIQKGELLAVVGRLGSGKTTLMRLLTGEIRRSKGEIYGPDVKKVAWVPQESFLQSGTLQTAVTAGFSSLPEEQASVMNALRLAQFEQDIQSFPSGLGTKVGEKGITLSGGQKQRVSLARAIHMNEIQHVLLDDPISALDTRTGRAILDTLICHEWSHLTRVVTTHRMEICKKADRIVVLNQGTIEDIGTWDELLGRNPTFQSLLQTGDTADPA